MRYRLEAVQTTADVDGPCVAAGCLAACAGINDTTALTYVARLRRNRLVGSTRPAPGELALEGQPLCSTRGSGMHVHCFLVVLTACRLQLPVAASHCIRAAATLQESSPLPVPSFLHLTSASVRDLLVLFEMTCCTVVHPLPCPAPGAPGQGLGVPSQGNLLDWADKALGQGISSVTRGVKNLLSGARQAPVAAALEALMDGKQVSGCKA